MDAECHVPVDLPHRGVMRWVREAALSPDGNTAVVRGAVHAAHPFVLEGCLLPAALLEWMAQAAAAGSALRAGRTGRRVKRGLLAAVQEFSVYAPLPVGSEVEICAVHERSFGALRQMSLEVRIAGQRIAQARMIFHLILE
jgi:predicted hotdog family 3-hydroxylacyl-ACP dehydratase